MLTEFLANFNWVDVLIIAVGGWCIREGIQNGIVVEFLKVVGTFLAALIALHYYGSLAGHLYQWLGFPKAASEFCSFIILWLLIEVIFKLVRDGWVALLRAEANRSRLNRWAGAILGGVRVSLVASLMLVGLLLTQNSFVSQQVLRSFSNVYLLDVAPHLYGRCFDGFVSKLFSRERKNEQVFNLRNLLKVKPK